MNDVIFKRFEKQAFDVWFDRLTKYHDEIAICLQVANVTARKWHNKKYNKRFVDDANELLQKTFKPVKREDREFYPFTFYATKDADKGTVELRLSVLERDVQLPDVTYFNEALQRECVRCGHVCYFDKELKKDVVFRAFDGRIDADKFNVETRHVTEYNSKKIERLGDVQRNWYKYIERLREIDEYIREQIADINEEFVTYDAHYLTTGDRVRYTAKFGK